MTDSAWWRRHAPALLAAALAVGVAAVLVVPAPGGGSDDSRGGTAVNAYDSGGTASRDLGPASGTGATAPGAGIVGGTGGGVADAAVPDDATRVVRTGSLSLAVDEGKVPATVARVEAVVEGVRGYVADSSTEESGERPVARLTARVPVASFSDVLTRIRGLGATVVSSATGGRDVTAQYADTKAQIQSLQAARARFLVILSGARTISETLTVQQRVDDVQRQIDRLEAQRRVLADSSDLATVTVTVTEEGDSVLVAEPASGWSKAWDDAIDGFVGGLQGLLARSGRVLLVLLVAAALYPLARIGLRRARRRDANPLDAGAAPIA